MAAKRRAGNQVETTTLCGTYFHTLDDKSRLSVPLPLRHALTNRFYATVSSGDNLLFFSVAEWDRLMDHMRAKTKEFPAEMQDIRRRIVGNARVLKADAGWRVVLPEELRSKASLRDRVVFVGDLDRVELLDYDKHQRVEQQRIESDNTKRLQKEILGL